MTVDSNILLDVRALTTNFFTYEGVVNALDNIDLKVGKGEVFGLVGESGCGKSVLAASILRLVEKPGKIVSGEIFFEGEDLLKKTDKEMRHIRGGKIAIVFQDPMTYLNPVLSIGDQLIETIIEHQKLTETSETNKDQSTSRKKTSKKVLKQIALRRAETALETVKMQNPKAVLNQHSYELSGGMRQRVMIAIAISCNPNLLILDEATTFLDVTIQRQILELVKDLKQLLGCTLIIITHDLGIVAELCDRVAVMYAGTIVEFTETKELFHNPLHPYTIGLLNAIPQPREEVKSLESISGSVPNLINPPSGCRFHPRCHESMEACSKLKPELVEVEKGHFVACQQHELRG